MATFLYLLYWLAHRAYDTFAYDTQVACLLLALDTNTLLRYWLWKQSGR